MTKEKRTIQYSEDHMNSIYAQIILGVADGLKPEEFEPPLNEMEIEWYEEVKKIKKENPDMIIQLYED